MGYIDEDYYKDDYKGEDAGDNLEKYIERASDIIDQLTGYKIDDLEDYPKFIKDLVKKATAAQVEMYAVKGGYTQAETGGTFDSVTIGKFSYSSGDKSKSSESSRFSPAAIGYLQATGLLYAGVGVVDCG